MNHDSMLDGVRERFDASTDFTVGLEEEYQLLDPGTLALVNRFEDVIDAARPPLVDRLAGELIASEVEYKTRAHGRFADAARELVEGRLAVADLVEELDMRVGVAGVHPFSPWQEQRIIDTPHYRLVEGELGYIAWVNNTWSIHLHVGVRGADRAMAACTAMRSVLPELLALSANSPVYGGRDTRLASMRTQIFTKSFPRCGVPDAYPDWESYARHVELLERTGSIIESTQIWWSVRPHHAFGTVEVRICDGQTEMAHALGVTAFAMALLAGFLADYDAGRPLPRDARGLIDENMWRAQRHALDGELIDLAAGTVRPARDAIRAHLERTAPQQEALGLGPFIVAVDDMLRRGNGAERQRTVLARTGDALAVQREIADETRASAERLRDALAAEDASAPR